MHHSCTTQFTTFALHTFDTIGNKMPRISVTFPQPLYDKLLKQAGSSDDSLSYTVIKMTELGPRGAAELPTHLSCKRCSKSYIIINFSIKKNFICSYKWAI
jgi:hypothetical protein